jgi:HK97 family phage major capsid protein
MTLPETIAEDAPGIREQLLEVGDSLRELYERKPDTSDKAAVENWKRDASAAIEFIHTADPILATREAAERSPQGGGAGTLVLPGHDEARSPGTVFTTSDAYTKRQGNRHTDEVEVRTLLDSATTGPAAGIWRPAGTPLPPMQRQARLFVRDLITVQDTGLSSVPYIRELNPQTSEASATAVSEGAAKPEVEMNFVQADAPVRKLAAWIPVTEEIIADAPTLRGYIDSRLAYMLAFREEAQILAGNGTAPALRGILNTTGIQAQAFSTDVISTLGLALGKVENVDGEADGIAMNPLKFWTMLTTRSSSQFDQGYGGGGPFGIQPTGVWGVPVVRTRQLTLNQAVVGSWRMGATLFQREGITIRTTDSHSDYFIYNKLVILAEERVGLAVFRPDFFVEATLA